MNLTTGPKAIYPTNDFFLNYTFKEKKNWETLRDINNIIIEAYQAYAPSTHLQTIQGPIVVETQYAYYTSNKGKPKTQDFGIDTDESITFMEVQNNAFINPPLEIRARDYLAHSISLSLGNNKTKAVTQIWLLANDNEKLLNGQIFTNYVLTDETTGHQYPLQTNLMAISLKRLAKLENEGAQLAQFLSGYQLTPTTPRLNQIIKSLQTSMITMKQDKEVSTYMSKWDEHAYTAKATGKAEAIAEMLEKMAEFVKKGLTAEEIMQQLQSS